jgi:hypothetical protein
VLGIQSAHNGVRVTAPSGCQVGRFTVRVRAALARRVELFVDGGRRAVSTKVSRRRHAFRVNARRHARGVHHLTVRVTFLDGSVRARDAKFRRCAPVMPRFTG